MASSDEDQEWVVNITCPFCQATIVEAVDYSLLPDDMPDEEREEITCGGEPDFVGFDSHCEHVAYLYEYGFVGTHVPDSWKSDMIALARAFNQKREPPLDDPEGDFMELIDEAWVFDSRPKKFESTIKKTLPGCDSEFVKLEVDKGGENPVYGVIFLRRKK